jgi:2'-hydroxyisoflavone reductase
VLALENGARGHYTTTGPATPLNWGAWLAACLQVAQEQGTPAQIAYVPNALLEAQAITGQQLPFWISEAEHYGIFAISVARAIADGMTYRPLIDTVRDTLAWHRTRGDDYILRAGLTADDEARLLALAASAQ